VGLSCYTARGMSNEPYSLFGYGSMIADRIRIDAFMQAMRGAIRPGAVVMDIGTGPGVMAVLACQLGASRVYAIDPSVVIQVAREVAAANHCADRISFFEDLSTNVEIPVRADVIVSDMRGVLPLYESHIPSIADARRRFLAPGGTLIGHKDRIWAAVVEAPEAYAKIVDPWDRNALRQDLTRARLKVLNEFRKERLTPQQLLTAPMLWATLDYTTIENPDIQGTLRFVPERNGIGHGILVWFDAELADGVGFSNGPASPEAIYSSAFFPWLEPVPLSAGQNVCFELDAKFLENDYFWRWTTQIESMSKAGETVAQFKQSQLQGAILSLTQLHKSASGYIPQLSADGLIRRRILELMDGKASLEEIARPLASEFPERFATWHQALSFAAAVSKENSR
jgi:type I protein arginine methyltransferase